VTIATTTALFDVTAAGVPAWWSALPDMTNTAIAGGASFSGSPFQKGTTVNDAAATMGYVPGVNTNPRISNTGLAAITNSWGGAAVDTSRAAMIMLANGGHADYGGNEGYILQLKSAVPGWKLFIMPTPDNRLNYSDSSGGNGAQNLDGRMRACHNASEYVYADGKLWFGCQTPFSSPSGGNVAWMWSFDMQTAGIVNAINGGTALAWDGTAGPWHNIGPSTFPGGNDTTGATYDSPAVYDPVNKMAWWACGYGFDRSDTWIWNVHTSGASINTGTGWLINGGNPYADFTWAVCCPDLGLIVMGDGAASHAGRFVVFEIAHAGGALGTWYYAPGVDSGAGTVSGTPYSGTTGSTYPWAVYQQVNHSILIGEPVDQGLVLHKIAIPMSGGNYQKGGVWTCSTVNLGGTPYTFAPTDKAYTKFNVIPDMGDGRSALIYVGDIGKPTYVAKLPSAGA
jgi:hypothetical protein